MRTGLVRVPRHCHAGCLGLFAYFYCIEGTQSDFHHSLEPVSPETV
jgi:hypothetical protein